MFNFLFTHKSYIEIVLIGVGGITASTLVYADLVLKVLIGICTFGLLIFKGIKEFKSKKRK